MDLDIVNANGLKFLFIEFEIEESKFQDSMQMKSKQPHEIKLIVTAMPLYLVNIILCYTSITSTNTSYRPARNNQST